MRTLSDDVDPVERPDIHQLWTEALWGVGLIGGVLALVGLLAVAFGR
jgi:hypothetical protein